ncbi:MAG: hypothetical protein JNL74_19270, partial [Fibrobacteres bacterium]|nr:hypothetical protein [Fibrobacterota bacterium]
EALKEYEDICRTAGVVRTKLAATAVLRDPSNAAYVCSRIAESTSFKPEIISGEDEARFVYRAGTRSFPFPENKVVIDIGGGSVEFVTGNSKEIFLKKSLSIGAVKMTDRFIKTFPVGQSELDALKNHLRETYVRELSGFFAYKPEQFIGVAGTFTTAAAMFQSMHDYDPAKITGYQLKKDDVTSLLAKVSKMSIEEQKGLPGLHPKRAGYIVTGLVLVESFYQFFNIDSITVSDEGLRYGVLIDWIEQGI